MANWAGASVNHPSTPIALTGVHSSNLVTCTQCHTTTPYSTVKQTCDGCHHTDYVGAKDPDHVAGNFSTTCTTCHTLVAGWAGATFNHPTAPVALTGAHSPNLVTCAQCHTTMPYSTVKQTCDGCHHAEYVATSNPNHTASGYGTDCASCHQVVANWAGATVNHPSTPIALTGVHSANLINCTQCHTTTPYSTVKTTCDGCHHTDYVGAKDPDHVAGNFSTTCTTCHGLVSGWLGATFNHPTSPIALTGAHSANLVNCAQCHTTMPYSTVKQTCDGCHHADFVATTNPNHTAAGYSTDCSTCHQGGGQLGGGDRESPHDADRADGRAQQHRGAMRAVPHHDAVLHGQADVRRLPPRRLYVHDGPEPRGRQFLADLHHLSQPGSELGQREIHRARRQHFPVPDLQWQAQREVEPVLGMPQARTTLRGDAAVALPQLPRQGANGPTQGEELHAVGLRPVRMPRQWIDAVTGARARPGRPGWLCTALLLGIVWTGQARAQQFAPDSAPLGAQAATGPAVVYLHEGGSIRGTLLRRQRAERRTDQKPEDRGHVDMVPAAQIDSVVRGPYRSPSGLSPPRSRFRHGSRHRFRPRPRRRLTARRWS